jgi:hypothetical protein
MIFFLKSLILYSLYKEKKRGKRYKLYILKTSYIAGTPRDFKLYTLYNFLKNRENFKFFLSYYK